jgi:hypothetical protein
MAGMLSARVFTARDFEGVSMPNQQDRPVRARILHDTDGVLDDIARRVAADRASFGPLVAELCGEVELARSRAPR